MSKVLVVSLGGTPEPIIKSIEKHEPDYVCFFSSQKSNSEVYPQIKEVLDRKGILLEKESVTVNDENDLVHCYEKAMEISSRIERRGVTPADVVVDYTGGTKNMTAALVLATAAKGYKFSYVGGKERTKEGLGIVVSGSEEVTPPLNLWQVLYVEEKRKVTLFFNSYQFSAAKDITDKLVCNLIGLDKALFGCLSDLIEGYRLWDSFNHSEGTKNLGQGVRELLKYLDLKEDPILNVFAESVKKNLEFLNEIKSGKKDSGDKNLPTLFDLFHNAGRRAEEEKYDDAVARLYRSLEMIGQIEFEKEFKCSTSDVKVERIPESLRDEIRRHSSIDENSGKEKVKIGLKETFRVLNVAGNSFGSLFFANEKEINDLLEARNMSILAHGTNPIPKERYERLFSIVENFLRHTGADYKVEFPKLRWE